MSFTASTRPRDLLAAGPEQLREWMLRRQGQLAGLCVICIVMGAGAYGAVMASSYNTRPLAPEVMVDGTRFAVIRPRPTIDEMLSAERFPPWMEPIKP